MREPHFIFTFDATDDNPVGDLFPSYEECGGCPLCDPTEPATVHLAGGDLCVEPGCPCA